MTEKEVRSIELDKILYILQELAVCKETRARLLALRPMTDPDEMREALLETDTMASLLQKISDPRYSGVEQVEKTVDRAAKGGVLSMAELLSVAATLRNFRFLREWYGSAGLDDSPLEDLFYTLTPDEALEKQILDSVLSENEMADTASEQLFDIRRKIRNTESSIRDKLDHIIHSAATQKYLQETVVTLRQGRFVIPVKAEYRGEVSGMIHDVSASGSTLFIEPAAVVEANAKIMQLRNSEAVEIERILEMFSVRVASIQPLFGASYEAMLKIDALAAKAKLALRQRAFCPTVENEYRFQLHKARHPLIDREKVVPVDISLGYEYDSLIITGPNTGGKTVTLKTAGLLSAMAACGLLIPAAENSSVCVFQNILVDIGDEQSIEQSLSTFSGHIKNITAILQSAGRGCLVLMDELGAGTDPAEGAALAVAIIEQLRRQGASILATTHYAELKMFALETAGVQNASCEFNIETLQPTYRLSVGVPGRSNAFLISQKLGVSKTVIDSAQTHLSAEDKRFENILAQLDDLKLELKEKQAEVEQLQDAAGAALEKAAQQRDALVAQGEAELQAAREKAKAITQKIENEAYRLFDEMKTLQKKETMSAQQKAQRARQIARNDAETLYNSVKSGAPEPSSFPPLTQVKIGDSVVLNDLGTAATVTSLPDSAGYVEVLAGIVKTKVPLSQLHAPIGGVSPQTRRTTQKKQVTVQKAQRTASMEINLIGLTVEEAVMEAESFIDAAVLRGQHTLYLIHGKGTGALRKGLHQQLKSNKSVASFRLGRYGEGEDGVTVVELK